MAGGARNGHEDDMDRIANGRDGDMSDPAMLHLIELIERRLSQHERDCRGERQEAQSQREKLRDQVDTGFTRVQSSISKLHDRVNEVVMKAHEDAVLTAAKIHDGEKQQWDWRLKLAGWILATTVGLVGFLFAKLLGWF